MRGWRWDRMVLLAEQVKFDEFSVEGQAENAKFDFLVSACVYNEDNSPYFKDINDYLDRSDESHSSLVASHLSNLLHGLDVDYFSSSAENQFLKAHGFMNEEGSLVNKAGNLVDEDGKIIEKVKEVKFTPFT